MLILTSVMITIKTRKDLQEVLMEAKAKGIKNPYFVIHGDHQNITVLVSGTNGVEFNKTHGHFNTYQSVEFYTCLYGQGLILLQRNDERGEAKEFKVITIQQGKQVAIPAGYGHGLVNIGKIFLVVLDNAPNEPKTHDYQTVKAKKGFAYYVVEKKGEIAFEPNPHYVVHPQINTE